MTGLTLQGNSQMIDWLRKNEPRGDRFFEGSNGDGSEIIWDSSSQDDLNLSAPKPELWVIKGIEIIIEIRSGETIPTIDDKDLELYYPETQSVTAPVQKKITIDTTNRGLDALLAKCDPTTLKIIDMSSESGVKYIYGLLDLNYIILDSNLSGSQNQLLFLAQSGITIGGTGRIILRAKGWKINRNDW